MECIMPVWLYRARSGTGLAQSLLASIYPARHGLSIPNHFIAGILLLALLLPVQSWAKLTAAEYWVPVKCQAGVVFADQDISGLLEDATVAYYIKEYTILGKKETTVLLERATRYFPIFEKHLIRTGLPEGLKYMPMVESNLLEDVVSYAGAGGLWQFMPGTARFYGLTVSDTLDERTDPERATEAAVQFLADLNRQFCDWRLVLAAYNCGPGKVRRLLRQAGATDFNAIEDKLPEQTQKYISKFIAATYVGNHFQDFDLEPFASAKKTVTPLEPLPKRIVPVVTPAKAYPLPANTTISFAATISMMNWGTGSSAHWQQLIGQAARTVRQTILPFIDASRKDVPRYPELLPVPDKPTMPDRRDQVYSERFAVFRRSGLT